jgi:hypothetical protein
MHALRWRLVYADDSVMDERPDGSTIKDTRPLAVAVQVHRWGDGDEHTAIVQVFLEGQRPVFYRRRSMTLDGKEGPRTDAIVFGRGRVRDAIEAELWELLPDGTTIALPPDSPFADPTMVEWLVSDA